MFSSWISESPCFNACSILFENMSFHVNGLYGEEEDEDEEGDSGSSASCARSEDFDCSDSDEFLSESESDSETERAMEMREVKEQYVEGENGVQLHFSDPPDDERQFKRQLKACLSKVRELVEVGSVRRRWQRADGFADFYLHRPSVFSTRHLVERLVAGGFGRVNRAHHQKGFSIKRPLSTAELETLRARYQDEDILRYGLRNLVGTPPGLSMEAMLAAAASVAQSTVTLAVRGPNTSPLQCTSPDSDDGYWPQRFTAERQHPCNTSDDLRAVAGEYGAQCRAVEVHAMLPLKLAAVKGRQQRKRRHGRKGKSDAAALVTRLETALAATPAPAPPVGSQICALTASPEAPLKSKAEGKRGPTFFLVVFESLNDSYSARKTKTELEIVGQFGDQLSGVVVPHQKYGGLHHGRLLLHMALSCPCLTTLHLSGTGYIDDPRRLWEFSCRRLPLLADVELPEAFGYDWALTALATHCQLLRRLVLRPGEAPRPTRHQLVSMHPQLGLLVQAQDGQREQEQEREREREQEIKKAFSDAGLGAVLATCRELQELQCLRFQPFTDAALHGVPAPLRLCRVNVSMADALRAQLMQACPQLQAMGDGQGLAYSLDGSRQSPAARTLRHYVDLPCGSYPLDYTPTAPGLVRHAGTGMVLWMGHLELKPSGCGYLRREHAALLLLCVRRPGLDHIVGGGEAAGGGGTDGLAGVRLLVALQAAHGHPPPLVTDAEPGDARMPAACLAAGHCILVTAPPEECSRLRDGLWRPQGELHAQVSGRVKGLNGARLAVGPGEGADRMRTRWTVTVEGGCRGDGVEQQRQAREGIDGLLLPGLQAQLEASGSEFGDSTTGMKTSCKGWAKFGVTGRVEGV